jgi:hypothetical protein
VSEPPILDANDVTWSGLGNAVEIWVGHHHRYVDKQGNVHEDSVSKHWIRGKDGQWIIEPKEAPVVEDQHGQQRRDEVHARNEARKAEHEQRKAEERAQREAAKEQREQDRSDKTSDTTVESGRDG